MRNIHGVGDSEEATGDQGECWLDWKGDGCRAGRNHVERRQTVTCKGQAPCPFCCLLYINPDMRIVYICPAVWLPETFDKCLCVDMGG